MPKYYSALYLESKPKLANMPAPFRPILFPPHISLATFEAEEGISFGVLLDQSRYVYVSHGLIAIHAPTHNQLILAHPVKAESVEPFLAMIPKDQSSQPRTYHVSAGVAPLDRYKDQFTHLAQVKLNTLPSNLDSYTTWQAISATRLETVLFAPQKY